MYMQKLTPQALYSEAQPSGEFAAVRRHIKQLHDQWIAFYEEFAHFNSPYADEFRQHNQHFSQAVDQILTKLGTPTLVLATTANLLCGADIMPRMAGEMSAGIVTIKHTNEM